MCIRDRVTGYEGALNSINPFRITTKNASPVVDKLAELQYELNDGVINNADGVDLTPDEQQFIRKYMYDDGKFPAELDRAATEILAKGGAYDQWKEAKGTVNQVDRRQSEWYQRLSGIVNGYQRKALNKLRSDDSEVGRGFRARYQGNQASATTNIYANSLKTLIDFA